MKSVKLKVIISSLLIGTATFGGNLLPIVNDEMIVEASRTDYSIYLKDGKAFAQWGKTTVDLQSIDGYIYPAGTEVARASRENGVATGSFYLHFTVTPFFYTAAGEVAEKYVSITKSKIVDPLPNSVTLVENPIAPGAVNELLKPVSPAVQLDKKALGDSIKKAEEIDNNNVEYTISSIYTMRVALEDARYVFNNPNTDQVTINLTNKKLRDAINSLVVAEKVVLDKVALGVLINEATPAMNNPKAYTKETYDLFAVQYKKAKAVFDNPDTNQYDIDNSESALRYRYKKLELSGEKPIDPVPSKSALQARIKEADKKLADANRYTDASVEYLRLINNTAKDINNSFTATQQQIDEATDNLIDAIDKLVYEEYVAKGLLENTIKAAKSSIQNKHLYTEKSVQAVQSNLILAEEVFAEKKPTQDQVDKAITDLQRAILNLEKKPVEAKVDKTKLQDSIKQAEIVLKDESSYTVDTINFLKNEKANAEKVMSNTSATQAQVNLAINNLEKAVASLKVKTDKPEGNYIKDEKYVTFTNGDYNTWSNFNWKYRESGKNLVNKTFITRGKYSHRNGSTYISLHDNKGNWYGYVNEKAVTVGKGAQGAYIKDGRFVTVTKENYNTWSNFNWKSKFNGNDISNRTFISKGKYYHQNGSTYLSLFDNKGNWYGYINEEAVSIGKGSQGAYVKDGRRVIFSKSNYNTWSNFNWTYKDSGKDIVNKTFISKGKYYHHNGSTYLSLFDDNGRWYGYVNEVAVKVK